MRTFLLIIGLIVQIHAVGKEDSIPQNMYLQITYYPNGNINTKYNVGTYQYANNSHAVTGISNPVPGYSPPAFTLTCTSYNRPLSLTQQRSPNKKLNFEYNPDNRRNKTLYYENNVLNKTMYYVGNYEKEVIAGGNTNEYDYIYSPEGLAAIAIKTGGNQIFYYTHTDHLGSLRVVTTLAKSIQTRYHYDAWGTRTLVSGTSITNRGFTGHEHLPEFGFINMNARIYDPVIGRFHAMDPFVQMPDYTQAFNRYTYALNNPLIYVDEDGEFWHIIIGAFIGGVVNLVANWDNTEGFWQKFVAFNVGAGTGAITSGTNKLISQTGKNFEGINNVDWKQVGISSVIGGVAGAAGAGAGYGASNMSFLVNKVSSPVLRSLVVSPIASGAGHIAGGTTANLFAGQNLGEAFANSFKGLGQSMAIGGAIGMASTIGVSYANKVSPWTGRALNINTSKSNWNYGDHKSQTKWENQMNQRGWTEQQINEAILFGDSYSAPNNINQGHGATRYVHPTTGRSIVIDNVTRQIIHVGGDGFLY